MTYGFIVVRALVVGLAVGALLAGYLMVVVEPVVDQAIELEERMGAEDGGEAGHSHDEGALFTRTQQRVGGALAMILYSGILGVVFGTVYAGVRHRISAPGEFGRVVRLAAAGFVAVALLPALKYPAAPPGVGDPDTVQRRTVQYVVLIALGLLLAWLVLRLSNRLRGRLDDPTRIVVVTVTAVVLAAVALIALPPTPVAIDPAVPAALVWDFRVRSLGGLALLWAGLGLGLGWVLQRAAGPTGSGPVDRTPAGLDRA